MSKQPGIYSDIGKNATDLLYGDHIRQSPIRCHYNWLDFLSLYFKCQVSGIVPGLSTLLKLHIRDQRPGNVEVQYMNNYFGVATGITLAKSPLLTLSGVTGIGFFSIGSEISFDTATKTLTEYNAGLNVNTDILTASLTLSDKADTLRAHFYRPIRPLTSTGVAAEITHRFISKQPTLTLGAQHCLFPFMLIKARVTSDGSLGALVQNNIFSTVFLTIATELNVMDARNTAKLGFSLALNLKRTRGEPRI
ncbi:mitochondrial outer membrane protein porin of 36 kDa-like [Lycium barbarum]|uniref:mitochondrial outer membrane protein porin of 36 kDa-like n=1 Tax=Lycium barbarum TaxID=112863 RepID=UPI00293EF22B|nr:mitochondrial outer membrane protein porin of 36 kDa-like [Lycium barbarum]